MCPKSFKQVACWLLWIICFSIQVSQVSLAAPRVTTTEAYLQSLLEQARSARLHESRTWLLLLHYRRDLFGEGVTSEVDDEQFFFSAAGKADPRSELEATLRAFISPDGISKHDQPPQCVFPARFHWLHSQLNFDHTRMKVDECPLIELWLQRINAGSVSLVFSSYFLNNPASMFGHTLLRFDNADQSQPELLDFALSYSAQIENSVGFIDYTWRGLTGGFEGRFSIFPYYDRVKLYNDLESRDLWEYNLNLKPKQIKFMLLHAWELVNTKFQFYFMRENCSYHLLSLLEVANPDLNFRDKHVAWTLPTDTLKQVNKTPGLVKKIVRRPSLRNQLEKQLKHLNAAEKNLVKKLVQAPLKENSEKLNQVSDKSRADVLDTAITLSQFQEIANRDSSNEKRRIRHQLMIERSKLEPPKVGVDLHDVDNQVPPDQGHDSFRLALSGGNFQYQDDSDEAKSESFFELTIQPGFHDLLLLEDGHPPNSQIRFLSLTARYGEESTQWKLQEIALIDIISLSPVSTFLKSPSWKLNIGWEHNQDGACVNCTPFIFNVGAGIASQSHFHQKEVFFGFLEANLELDKELKSEYRGGYGATVGLLFNANNYWRIAFGMNRTRYTSGQSGYVTDIEFEQRFYYTRDFEIAIKLRQFGQNNEGKLGLAYYF